MSSHVSGFIVSDVRNQLAPRTFDSVKTTESFPDSEQYPNDVAESQDHEMEVAFRKRNGRCKREISFDQLLFWKAMMDLAPIRNPSLIWHERRQAFLRTYFSQCVIASHQTYNYILHERAPSNAALHAARDALGLIHLGSHSNNDQLLYEGRRRHVAALRCMSEQVICPKAVQNDGLLAASYALGQCEIFHVILQDGHGTRVGWTGHMAGTFRMFSLRGPSFDQSLFAQVILHKIRQAAVMEGFLKRKETFFAHSAWLTAAQPAESSAVKLTNIALRIVNMLARSDVLCRSGGAPQEKKVVRMLDQMAEVEVSLNNWLLEFYRGHKGHTAPYRLIPMSQSPEFESRLGELADVFGHVIEFPTLLSATTHAYVWICQLLLRQAMRDVAQLYPYPLVREKDQHEGLACSVDECAINVCQSIPYIYTSGSGRTSSTIMACSGPLYFASLWWQHRSHQRRASWCQRVKDTLRLDADAGGAYKTTFNWQVPIFSWWMLPDIFES